MKILSVSTAKRCEFVDITARVADAVRAEGVRDGLAVVYVPHTTAGMTINENADPDVVRDMLAGLERFVPTDGDYRHFEGNSAAHIKASLMGASQTVPVKDGRLQLGRWQGVYLTEFDGPRNRSVFVMTADASAKIG